MELELVGCKTEYRENPLGIETERPRFSWGLSAEERDLTQRSYRIQVRSGEKLLWDSGRQISRDQVDVVYQGEPLSPATAYQWTVEVEDSLGRKARAEQSFETGLMGTQGFQGAQWIGSATPSLCPATKGVFTVEAKLQILGTRGGIVFGAGDERLRDKTKNIQGVEGESWISYEIDLSTSPAKLVLTRVGYCQQDDPAVPLAVEEIRDVHQPEVLPITEENKGDWHTLRVEVLGNTAKAYVDGICVDGSFVHLPFLPQGDSLFVGRQLNPLSANDTITFPRLHQVGFTVPVGGEMRVAHFTVGDLRPPCTPLFTVSAKENRELIPTVAVEGDVLVVSPQGERKQLLWNPEAGGIPMLRGTFTLEKQPASARLYITARGIYEAFLNGGPVAGGLELGSLPKELDGLPRSRELLLPGASQFDRHLFYQIFDITSLLRPGENALGVLLSSGWWSDSQTFSLENHNYFGNRPSLLCRLEATYEDGTTQSFVSDCDHWRLTQNGPIRYSGYFAGERVDARLNKLLATFSLPAFDDSQWQVPSVVEAVPTQREQGQFHMWPSPNLTTPTLLCHPGEPVRPIQVRAAESRQQTGEGVMVYDMGQNMVGVPYLRVKASAGTKVWLRYGEILYPHLEEYGALQGTLLTENLRDAESIDQFICTGDPQGDVIFPRFTFHGYRYLELSGLETFPQAEEVKGMVISSFHEPKGTFRCENPLINRLYDNILWSQRANFISIPTDCPQRNERMGWMGDAQVFASTAAYNDDVRLFFERYLISVRDLQDASGRFPCIAPVGGGFGGIAWESAGVILPWEMYRHYGDKRILEENFQAMCAYGRYLRGQLENGILELGGKPGNLGDWLATDLSTDGPLIWNSIAIHDMDILARTAKVLGKGAEEQEFAACFGEMRQAFGEVFFDQETGKTRNQKGKVEDTQCSYALPLSYGIFQGEQKKAAARRLNEKTQELDFTLTTGFIGTPCIAPALSENGYGDTAYRLLSQTDYPSWLYPVTQGATSIWERWNSFTVEQGFGGNNNMNSFNHYSLGAVGYWLYSSVLGIRPGEEEPGYRRFILAPTISRAFPGAAGSYASDYGTIESSWSMEGNLLKFSCRIPPNTSALVRLPQGKLMEGTSPLESRYREDGTQELELGSGRYSLTVDLDQE